jgi:hypothetical protein
MIDGINVTDKRVPSIRYNIDGDIARIIEMDNRVLGTVDQGGFADEEFLLVFTLASVIDSDHIGYRGGLVGGFIEIMIG